MSKHTPGPWQVVGYPYYQYWITNEPPDKRGHVKVIASIEHQGYAEKPYFDAEAREANAKLIARAPEMHDEIERLQARLAKAEALLKEARAAIYEETWAMDLDARINAFLDYRSTK